MLDHYSWGEVDRISPEAPVPVMKVLREDQRLGGAGNVVINLVTLGAEVSASRPVIDSGWLPSFRQIGSSGSAVSPKLYFSLGISGAIQHVVGMKGSKNIIAVNKDPDAPIFEIADYGVVGDLFEIVPKLIAAVQDS